MKPPTFDYVRPASVAEAIDALAAHPDSKVLAGGQSLIPMMNMRLARPTALVDIGRLDELAGIEANGSLRVGATARQSTVLENEQVGRRWPLITAALVHVGHPATRARGTFGGSIAHGEPASELPAVMLACDARFLLRGGSGEREVAADDFFVGHYTTVLADDELLVQVEVPDPAGSAWGFGEIVRRHGDYALAGAAVRLAVDGDGTVEEARVALFGVSGRPIRATAAEEHLLGTRLGDERAAAEAGRAALSGTEVTDDSFVSATYRHDAAAAVVERALLEAALRRRGTN
ncbi:carbon-monoxide dehydrogenase medium subunit [Pseudonocardia sulfidoxydans NBRC 16205]|uniref:Carbon-monoxide dehydrogenase medium subunit n=1 Tax=Pseudonocardia sulfidoxydans NBRC 16205 TaxID=1223511 RepID=A0A511DJT5_9PSEU|nr:xanthine dehydrogenase family protein subunit M [Pseudonocardia sulfidoxydans]GEL25080.1 carbon-monoxide dehydrogenase medium subunit [Pseudonocardia sulfidoxydans NBRC 16205]